MMLGGLALAFALVALGSALPIYRHALSRSVGTFALVLGVPGYLFVYAFGQFEHPKKHWLLPALLGGLLLSGVFIAMGKESLQSFAPG
ncbi:MAG: hypothetical protein ACKVPX_05035 [Myxococcaceae bacterium]